MKKTHEELETIARRVLDAAKKNGTDQASAGVRRSRVFRVGTKNGSIDTLEESTDFGLGIRVFINNRYAESGISDFRPEVVDEFVKRTVDAARLLDEDPDRGLPEKELMEDPPLKDLDNYDPAIDAISKEDKLRMALETDKAARDHDSSIFHAAASYRESRSERVFLTSEGFEGHQKSTSFSVSGSAFVHDTDNKRRSQWSYRRGVKFDALENHEKIGIEAAKRAMACRGSGPIPTGTYDIAVENRSAGWLINLIWGPLSGRALHQNRSFLKDMHNEQIAVPFLTVTDNPLIRQGLSSRLFDTEGIPSRVRPIIENGVLKNYYLDTYYARKLQMRATTGSGSNIIFSPGEKSPEEIISGIEKGIWVTMFLGGNSNALTGDFSNGIGGFLIENGTVGRPVSEVNIGGKIQDILMKIAEIGNDPFPYTSIQSPAIKVSDISVAGT